MVDVEEVTPRSDRQDVPVGAMVRPRSRIVESPDKSCAVFRSAVHVRVRRMEEQSQFLPMSQEVAGHSKVVTG